MAVSSIRLIGEKRSGEKGTNFVRTYAKVWRVETTDPLDGPAVAMAASGIATQLVTTYASGNDSDSAALCISVGAEEDGDSRISWIVTEQYSTAPPGTPEALSNPNPFLDAPVTSVQFQSYRRPIYYSALGNPIETDAHEPFDPPLERDDSRAVYTIRRNEAAISMPLLLAIKDTINAAPWKGCPKHTVKLAGITASETQRRNQFTYHTVSYEFHLNQDTWNEDVANYGRRYYDLQADDYFWAKDPMWLGALGVPTADGLPNENSKITYQIYPEFDFNMLLL